MKKKNLKQYKNLKLYFILSEMPPLDHWPNRSQGSDHFDYANSQVISFIIQRYHPDNLRHAVSLFNQAKHAGCIIFDPTTKLWRGNPDWQP